MRISGILIRVSDSVGLVQQAIAIRQRLPGATRLRTELAASVVGDAHALDDGRPLAAVVLRGLVDVMPGTAAGRRDAWEGVGVLADTVSTSVLTLGLQPLADGARERALRAAADVGDPVHITPWSLRRMQPAVGAARVLVVENPSVIEAFAVRHGGRFPLVCTAGWPARVAVDLLQRLGVPLSYHGELDWRGVEICGWLQEQACVVPWRMTEQDYRTAPGGGPLEGRPAPTPWEPSLADAMAERGEAVHEGSRCSGRCSTAGRGEAAAADAASVLSRPDARSVASGKLSVALFHLPERIPGALPLKFL